MSIDDTPRSIYRFGEFLLDLDRQTLSRGDCEVRLRPKSFTVLTILLEHPGRLVTKAMLHDGAWKETVVTDDSLAHCIADIRRALGECGFEMIQTVPRRGYILEHAVTQEFVSQPRIGEERRLPPLRAASIAFALLTATVFLVGAGLGDKVTSRSDADASQPQTMTRADSLHDNMHANSEYQRGRFFFSRRGDGDLDHAEASFKKAIELDPSFGAAWTGLAGVYRIKYANGSLGRDEALPLLGDATRRAMSLDPQNAEAHIRRASYYRIVGDSVNAWRHEETAIALAPSDRLVLGLRAGRLANQGHFDEAIELQRRAIRSAPTSAVFQHNLVWLFLAAGRVEEAAVQARQYRNLKPPSTNESGGMFVDVLILQGKHEQALAPAHNIASDPERHRSLAMIYHKLDRKALADAALTRLMADEDDLASFYIAEVLAQRGDADRAIHLLYDVITAPDSDTIEQRSPGQRAVSLLSPYLIELRSDERWQALYQQVLEAYEERRFVTRASIPPATYPW